MVYEAVWDVWGDDYLLLRGRFLLGLKIALLGIELRERETEVRDLGWDLGGGLVRWRIWDEDVMMMRMVVELGY